MTAAVISLAIFSTVNQAHASPPAPESEVEDGWTMTRALVLPRVGRGGRAPIHLDPIEATIVAGTWAPPVEAQSIEAVNGQQREWSWIEANENGWVQDRALYGGYAYWAVESDREQVMILNAAGHRMVYVNGEPRGGDVYGTGWPHHPVKLEAGTNHFLFPVSRGRLRASLKPAVSDAMFSPADRTMPDLIDSEVDLVWGGVIVINATDRAMGDLTIYASAAGFKDQETKCPIIAPMTSRKVPFRFGGPVPEMAGPVMLKLELRSNTGGEGRVLDTTEIEVPVRGPRDKQKRTFISRIDGSVQYYAVVPMHPPADAIQTDAAPAMVLTLHGASVEARGQAGAYGHKDWTHIVAPTNRRPYGFDWEEWGRIDAMEVLEINQRRLNVDPNRTYLTGHSMGGHGTWTVGATLPDRFAAIAPSAGWVSFRSYGGAPEYDLAVPIELMLDRAVKPSDTLGLSRNFLHYGIYILHGKADDNVPASQARTMVQHLAEYHDDFALYMEPGAGHWWGNQCVDWPPLFEFLKRHTRPAIEDVNHIEFATANPENSAWSRWLGLEAQIIHGEISSATADLDRKERKFTIVTDNLARLALKVDHLPANEPIDITIDEEDLPTVAWPDDGVIRLARSGSAGDAEWMALDTSASAKLKGPHRYGPFKNAFDHQMMFVYGTVGTEEENRWAYAKARFDAETFWYRGNGAVDLIPDTRFDPRREKDRGVVIYGNAETNAAWNKLLTTSPVQVRRGEIIIGDRSIPGDDLACLFIRPRPDSDMAAVAVVTGSGVEGMRLTDRMPYFLAGVGYPDCIVMGPEALSAGIPGVRAAGFFGLDWSVEGGQFAWSAD